MAWHYIISDNLCIELDVERSEGSFLKKFIPKAIRAAFRSTYYHLNTKKLVIPSEEDKEVLSELDKEFALYNDALSKEFNMSLSIWK